MNKLNLLLSVLLTGNVLLMSSCSLAPQKNYTTLAEQERQLATKWAPQDDAKQLTSLNELISSPELDALIEEALLANPSLQQTALTLKILHAQRRQATADRLPEASLDGETGKTESRGATYTGSLSISWEVDLWQKLADNERAAEMDVAEQEAILRASPEVVSRQDLEEAVWSDDIPDSNSLKVHIFHLRKAIDSPFPSPLLQTIPGHGFAIRENSSL